jgi:hypothetical protein
MRPWQCCGYCKVILRISSDQDGDQGKSGSLSEVGAHCREGALLVRVEAKAGKEKQVAEFLQNALAPAIST